MTMTFERTERNSLLDRLLTAAQVAARLNVTAKTIVRWIEEGRFPGSFKINPDITNSPFVIPEQSVEEFERERNK